MKTKAFVSILFLVFAVMVIAGSCATGKKTYISEENLYKELAGTWINEEYEPTTVQKSPQVTVYSDGSYETYKMHSEMTAPLQSFGHYISIKKAWIDSKGKIWYQGKGYFKSTKQTFYDIGKISDSGKVWEYVYSTVDYPDEMDSENFNYRIYYRQE
jgi:hypothetical protein